MNIMALFIKSESVEIVSSLGYINLLNVDSIYKELTINSNII